MTTRSAERIAIVAAAAVASLALAACTNSVASHSSGRPGSEGEWGDAGPPGLGTGSAREECNGLDDDGDGRVDEGCPCTAGARQACWPGVPERRGVGSCRDGQQTCVGSVEFTEWGPCEGAILPATESPDGRLDSNCDGRVGDVCTMPGGCETGGEDPGGGDDGGSGDDGGGGGDRCTPGSPPAMLIVLDRTQSMHRNPAGVTPTNPARSKWALAISAIESILPAFDGSIAFGLELFPREATGCVTLEQRLAGTRATNASCEAGEVVVAPMAGASMVIAARLDPLVTRLCNTTPIGLGIATAASTVSGISSARSRSILLITDGRETCDSRPVEQAQGLATAGVKTYVVAFDESGGIDERRLNNLACAGRTAVSFPVGCIDAGGGRYVAADPAGPRLFHFVTDEAQLAAALRAIGDEVACRP